MRVTNSPSSRKRRIRTIKAAKGFRLRRSKLYRYASDALDHGLQYAYRDRRQNKRVFRALWITRINAAARLYGLSYSRMMDGLKKAGVQIDRKQLAVLAIDRDRLFGELADTAKKALGAAEAEAAILSGGRATY